MEFPQALASKHVIIVPMLNILLFFVLFPGVKFRFDPASYSVSEADGMATLTIVQFDRAAGATGDITVLFSTADGTAEGEG